MIELLFLLLPVAVTYGWYMGRRSAAQQQDQEQSRLSERYVTGLNYLLSDQADKAVDLFIEMMEVDHDTIETHMALASLFRRRGETDRAIKIHQNVLERSSISKEQYNLAALELARDFSAAGLLDRALTFYKKVLGKTEHAQVATREIVEIFQAMKEWKHAIAYAEKLPENKLLAKNISQFHCELASESDQKVVYRAKHLKKALQIDPLCVRANMALGELYHSQGELKLAIGYYQEILSQDVDLVTEALPKLETCYKELGDLQAFQAFLIRAVEKGAGTSVVIALAELLKKQDLAEDAEVLELTQLRRYPSLKGFFHYMEYHVARIVDTNARHSLSNLHRLVGRHLAAKPKYRCRTCGFSANFLHWQCPSCKSWGEIKPVRGLDGE